MAVELLTKEMARLQELADKGALTDEERVRGLNKIAQLRRRSTSIADCAAYRIGTGSRSAEVVCVRGVLAPVGVVREGGAA